MPATSYTPSFASNIADSAHQAGENLVQTYSDFISYYYHLIQQILVELQTPQKQSLKNNLDTLYQEVKNNTELFDIRPVSSDMDEYNKPSDEKLQYFKLKNCIEKLTNNNYTREDILNFSNLTKSIPTSPNSERKSTEDSIKTIIITQNNNKSEIANLRSEIANLKNDLKDKFSYKYGRIIFSLLIAIIATSGYLHVRAVNKDTYEKRIGELEVKIDDRVKYIDFYEKVHSVLHKIFGKQEEIPNELKEWIKDTISNNIGETHNEITKNSTQINLSNERFQKTIEAIFLLVSLHHKNCCKTQGRHLKIIHDDGEVGYTSLFPKHEISDKEYQSEIIPIILNLPQVTSIKDQKFIQNELKGETVFFISQTPKIRFQEAKIISVVFENDKELNQRVATLSREHFKQLGADLNLGTFHADICFVCRYSVGKRIPERSPKKLTSLEPTH